VIGLLMKDIEDRDWIVHARHRSCRSLELRVNTREGSTTHDNAQFNEEDMTQERTQARRGVVDMGMREYVLASRIDVGKAG